jgi:aminoglycoside phosphotransferase (APT) family kinase protein
LSSDKETKARALTGEHILWDAKNKQINIIDFSDRAFGDPASDFTGSLEYSLNFHKACL